MDGNTLKAGVVAGVSHLRNPVLAARLVMEQSPHVMMIGEGQKICVCSWHGARLAGDFLHTLRWRTTNGSARGRATVLDHSGAPLDENKKWAP